MEYESMLALFNYIHEDIENYEYIIYSPSGRSNTLKTQNVNATKMGDKFDVPYSKRIFKFQEKISSLANDKQKENRKQNHACYNNLTSQLCKDQTPGSNCKKILFKNISFL